MKKVKFVAYIKKENFEYLKKYSEESKSCKLPDLVNMAVEKYINFLKEKDK